MNILQSKHASISRSYFVLFILIALLFFNWGCTTTGTRVMLRAMASEEDNLMIDGHFAEAVMVAESKLKDSETQYGPRF